MRWKYYLRGLGCGILITTIILSISLRVQKEKLSDSEIIQRAEALGMVMGETESESKTPSESKTSSESGR